MPKRNRRRPKEEYVHYVVIVTGWDHYYSFGTNRSRLLEDGPYSEIATVTFSGDLFRPEDHPCQKVTVTLSGKADLMAEREPPLGIGALDSAKDILHAYIFVPIERLAQIAAVAASGRAKAVVIIGTRLRYRRGRVIGINIHTAFDEDEW